MKERMIKVIKNATIVLVLGLAYAVLCTYTDLGLPCMFREYTGLKCPGCGTTHMCLALLKFDFELAFECNRFLFCLLPVAGYYAVMSTYRFVKYGKTKITRVEQVVLNIIGVMTILWGVVRNLFMLGYLEM